MIKITNFFKLTIACIICFTVQINSVSAQTWPPFGMNGNGTAASPWEITTITQLENLASYVNAGNGSQTAGKYYILMNDVDHNSSIVISVLGWNPIGNNATIGATFQGNFNGNGKKVTDIWINRGSTSCIGLFGYVYSAHIHDLGIEIDESQSIKGRQYVGGLIGISDSSIIENCYAVGNVAGSFAVGGLVGWLDFGTVSNSYAICDVSEFIAPNMNNSTVGGFVGANNGTIINCYATGNVNGLSLYTGGFVGANRVGGGIFYCYATGNITATGDYVGGLAGENQNGSTLINCVAANHAVGGGSNVGRVSGTNTGILSHNYAYNDMVISGGSFLIGNAGISATMATLMSFNFYNTGSNWLDDKPWNIDTNDNILKIWKICDGETLPFLQWQQGIECTPTSCYFDEYGTGTQGDPYRIYYPCQLADLAAFVNQGNGMQTLEKHFKLMNDLDLIDYSYDAGWDPIGYGSHYVGTTLFYGDFDGNGKVITNLKIDGNTHDHIGLFGSTSNATIYDLGIEGCHIGNVNAITAGGLGGSIYLSTIKNCYATGNVTSTGYSTGGLVGDLDYSILENSYSTCDVTGIRVGGLVGQFSNNLSGTVNNCYAIGNIIGTSAAGGLVGVNYETINNCYASGNVTGSSVGGVLGANFYTLENCVAANSSVNGSLNGTKRIVGLNYSSGALSNNYAYEGMLVNGATVSGGTHNSVNGEDKPMATLESFNFYNTGSNWYSSIPWDIAANDNPSKVWKICDTQTLPFFQWQGIVCSKSIPYDEDEEIDTAGQNDKQLAIFPNPASGAITISATSEIEQLQIFDIVGRLIHSQTSTSKEVVFDTGILAKGVYLVQALLRDGAVQTGKVVVN